MKKSNETKKGIFLNLSTELIEYVRRHDPTGQRQFRLGLLYIVRLLQEQERKMAKKEAV